MSVIKDPIKLIRPSSWFVVIVAVFVTTLITSNIVAVKQISFFGIIIDAGTILFPISYIFGDVLTEVYGYREARRVIWLGFLCNLLFVVTASIAQVIPAAPFWDAQAAYERILGYTPRLLAASFLAYLIGNFSNSFVLAKMKIVTQGRWLWMRTIGSTVVGEGLDSLVFVTAAFIGTVPSNSLLPMILAQWIFKTSYEALATPLTYWIVRHLKKTEGIDTYDTDTNFNPLLLNK